jgi:ribonuclease D
MPPVTYLDADERVAGFLDAIGGSRDLAVDTEGASFHRFIDRVYLLQLSTRSHHAILDPLAVTPPPSLGALLADASVEVVFHDADYDLRLLHQDYGWRVGHLFDTRVAAQLLGIRQFGLAALLESEFGVRLDKRHQRADWSMRPLSEAMLAYAAQDTMHLLPLRDRFRTRLEKQGRMHWAEEEFARLQRVEWEPDAPDAAFLRIKGARDLSRRELALMRELVRWRDQAAAAVDRATFRVMANEALLEIARQAPSSLDDLAAIKGVPRNLSPTRAAEVLAAVKAGADVPEDELPKFPRAPRWDRDPNFDSRVSALRTARDAVAEKLGLEPGVLGSRERLEAVARRAPESVDDLAAIPDLRRWQIEVLGDELIRALKRENSSRAEGQNPR